MQRGTAIHRQAASALSETRSKYILNPSKLSGLSRGLRKPKHVLNWLRAVCADQNRHSIGFAQCARTKTGTRLGGCGRQRSLAGYMANFSGLGRGLREAKRTNALPL